MAEILFVCPACSKNLAVESAAAGCRVPCPDCGAWLTVPTELYAFPCPGCEGELHAPAGMPVDSFQCPLCQARIVLPAETRRLPAAVQASEGGTVRVKAPTRRVGVIGPPGTSGGGGAGGPAFTPRRAEASLPAFNSRAFTRRLWLAVFSVAGLLLALIYLDVTFDTGLRVFDFFIPRGIRGETPAPAPARTPAPSEPADERLLPWERAGLDAETAPASGKEPAQPSESPAGASAPALGPLPPARPPVAEPEPVVVPAPMPVAATESPAPPDAAPPSAPQPQEEAPLPPAVMAARRVYDQRLNAIQGEHERRVGDWAQAYRVALATLRDRMQQAGNLDGWIAVRGELDRFAAEPAIPDAAAPSPVRELAALQGAFQERHASLLLSASQETLDLAERYIRHLEFEQQDRTRAGQFDEALLVKREIERVKAGPAYSAAAFHLAVLAAQPPTGTQAPGVAPSDTKPAPTNAAAPSPASAAAAGGTGAPVIRWGVRGAAPQGVTFERLALRATGPARERDNYEAMIMRGISSNLQSRADASNELTGSVTETVVNNYIVVGLRTTSRTHRIESARVTIEYFVRGLAPAEGKEVPRRLTVDTIDLPELVNEWVYIDCTPITTRQVSSEYRGAAFTRRTVGGEVLHGVIVSIARRGGKPLYEGIAAVP